MSVSLPPLVAVAALLAAVVVPFEGRTYAAQPAGRARAGSPRPVPRSGAAARPTFECDDALDDGTLIDERQADVLARLAATTRWLVGDPPPAGARPRAVRLFCGPDLDGDGDRESIVELTFPPAASEDEAMSSVGDGSGPTFSMLVSKHAQTWRAVAGVAVDLAAGPDAERGAMFVRRPAGRWGLEARRSSGGSEHDCRVIGYEVFELHASVLRSVKTGDRSLKCLPCGCDNP